MKSVKENAQLDSAMCCVTASMPYCRTKNPTPRSMYCNSALYYDKMSEKKIKNKKKIERAHFPLQATYAV